jgi:hypothetical protein
VLRPSAAPALEAPLSLFSACEFVAVLLQVMRVCSLAAVLRSSAAAPLAARPLAALAPPAPLSAAFGRTAVLPNSASLAGDDASAARYTPQRTPNEGFKMILILQHPLKSLKSF